MSGRALPRVRPMPRAPFVVLAVVASIVILGVALPAGHGAMFPVRVAPVPVQAARDLRFRELPDDTLAVFDIGTQRQVALVPAASNGFLHALVHGLQVTRKRDGVPADRPYALTLYDDGRLVLSDPPTRTLIDLEGFGPTNMKSLLALLGPESTHP